MRGFAFFLDAFFALLLVGFFAQLEVPPAPDFQTLHLLKTAANLSRTSTDVQIIAGALSVPPGICVRVTGPTFFQSCESDVWVGVPRTVRTGERFVLYRVQAGFAKNPPS